MEKPKPITITITGTFGSEMQRDIAERTLKELLAAWKGGVETRHKKNKITVKEE